MRLNLATLPFFDFSRREFLKGAVGNSRRIRAGHLHPIFTRSLRPCRLVATD
jgi:hypothetical protein